MEHHRNASAEPDTGSQVELLVPDHHFEALIVSPGGDILIVGWIDDATNPLRMIHVRGRGWRISVPGDQMLRVRRHDVEAEFPSGRHHPFGFSALGSGPAGAMSAGACEIDIKLSNGLGWTRAGTASAASDEALRDTALSYLAGAAFFGNKQVETMVQLDGGAGNAMIKLNMRIVARTVRNPYVERIASPRSRYRGTMVVCIYGKAEFLMLQNALFAGGKGMDDYEMIFVCNSPELAETLLREARLAHRLYGIDQSVVLLSGNAGFGAANNVAAAIARSGQVIAVNPDVFPRDSDWAAKHTAILDSRPAAETALFGVPLYYEDGSLMHGGMYYEFDRCVSPREQGFLARDVIRVEHFGKGAPSAAQDMTRPRPGHDPPPPGARRHRRVYLGPCGLVCLARRFRRELHLRLLRGRRHVPEKCCHRRRTLDA